jgi:uncharacterized protein (TIGR02646 family)
LKKTNKSLPPNDLTRYAQNFPQHNWDVDFRNSNQGAEYKAIKELIFNEQGGLCAFCENEINDAHKRRVEHFHPKSDITNSNHNWALDWTNVIGVCLGGSDVDTSLHPLPANLSCDAYKDHLIVKNKLPIACEGYLLNPLQLSAFPCLFDLNKRTGELKAKDGIDNEQINIENNHYNTVTELVEKTIEHLNLNCDRLNRQRLAVLKQYNQEIAKARKRQDRDIFLKLAKRWFQSRWLSFFTTRRILLNQHAENYLININFIG